MTLKEFYKKIDGDYDDVVQRLVKEARVEKFILKFIEDKTYICLVETLDNGDTEKAFRFAHTLKGLCMTLGFKSMYSEVIEITEYLRNGERDKAMQILPELSEKYNSLVESVNLFIACK